MPITIVKYTEDLIPEVVRFNSRLRDGGVTSQFPCSPVPAWLPRIGNRRLFQEYFLALDDDAIVRGAYILKRQDFWIGGRVVPIADFHLPISEGVVNRRHAQLGVRLLLDAQQKEPLLYALGMGGYEEALPRLLKACRWEMFSVPFFFRISHPGRFLRNITYLRRSAPRRYLLDMLAFSGLGWAGVKIWQALRSGGMARAEAVTIETVEEFSGWADDLWEACKTDYGMSAVRDAETLRILYPREKQQFIRLKISRHGKPIGWAVLLDSRLSQHKQFGNMRLGSLVDCLAAPAHAPQVVAAARNVLEQRGVDLIVSNQSHAAWCRALDEGGFMRGPSNSIFAQSKRLAELLKTSKISNDQIHLNRGDGDGPINL